MYRKSSRLTIVSNKINIKQIQLKYNYMSNRYNSDFTLVNTQSWAINFEVKENLQLNFKPDRGTLAPNESISVKVTLRTELYDILQNAKLEDIHISLKYDDGYHHADTPLLQEHHTLKATLTEDAFLHLRTDLSNLKIPIEQKEVREERPDYFLPFKEITKNLPNMHNFKILSLAILLSSLIYFDICMI